MKTIASVFLCLHPLLAFAADSPDKTDLLAELEQLKVQQAEILAMQDKLAQRIATIEAKLVGEVAPPPKPQTAPEPAPVIAGTGKIRFQGLVQQWLTFDEGPGGINSAWTDGFSTRRIELQFLGDITPTTGWRVRLDAAKGLRLNEAGDAVVQGTNVLQDAVLYQKIAPNWRLDVGQQCIGIGMESECANGKLDTVERSMIYSEAALAATRDKGVWVRGFFPEAELTVMLLNGVGENQNTSDNNERKALGGRFVYTPAAVPGLHVGVSGVKGDTGPNNNRRERWGAEMEFMRGPWKLSGEAVKAWNGDTELLGWYGHIGYFLGPRWEVVGRFDRLDPDLDVLRDQREYYTVGLNHYILGHNAKLQINWVHRRFFDGTADRDLFMTNFQTYW